MEQTYAAAATAPISTSEYRPRGAAAINGGKRTMLAAANKKYGDGRHTVPLEVDQEVFQAYNFSQGSQLP